MKRYFITKGILFTICLIAIITLFSISTIKSEASSVDIMNGIKDFQGYINSNLPFQYLGTSLVVDGYAGDLTKAAAVKLLQYKLNTTYGSGLEVDGHFGQASQNAYYNSIEKIQRYDLGEFVYILQGLLYCHEYNPVGFDGSYGTGGGTGCLNAVNQYKADNAITEFPDTYYGTVGVQTIACLCWKTYIVPTIHLDYDLLKVNEGNTKKLISKDPPAALSVSWSSDNLNVASVNSNGIVTGNRAGSANISAYCYNTLTGQSYYLNCYTVVTILDGVYYILNNFSNMSLHTQNGGIVNGTNVYQYSKILSNPESLCQLWRIQYLDYGYYSVRPMHKLNMGLDVSNSNVDIWNIGTTDNFYNVPSYARWTISKLGNGYCFMKNGSSSETLSLSVNSLSQQTNVDVQINNGYLRQSWTLQRLDNPPKGVILYDSSGMIQYNPTRYVSSGETLSLHMLNLKPAAYSGVSINQDFFWTSDDTTVATVNYSTGEVTGVSPGIASIRGTKNIGGQYYYITFSLTVTLENGIYYMSNRETCRFVDIENQVMSNGTQIHQWGFHSGNSQKWELTHIGDGYYTIKSKNSSTNNFYLGVQNDSTANNKPIVLRSGTITDGMKWRVLLSPNGSYKITPKTGAVNNRVLAVGWYIFNENGVNIEQRDYVNDSNYKDEWFLYPVSFDYALAYLGYSEGDSAMIPLVNTVKNEFIKNALSGYSYRFIDPHTTLMAMSTSKVFNIITHGDSDRVYIKDAGAYISVGDITGLPSNAFDNTELIVYSACLTGHGGSASLVNKTHNKGVDTVIGFTVRVYNGETYDWSEAFMVSIANGGSVQDALDSADLAAITFYRDYNLPISNVTTNAGNRNIQSIYNALNDIIIFN